MNGMDVSKRKLTHQKITAYKLDMRGHKKE